MDIHSKGKYPSNMLSNFAPHEFEIDGIKCGGMEGFLQSLKYRNATKQKAICALSGKAAKAAGSKKWLWKWTHNVWWQGKKIKRTSDEFQKLIDRAYMMLSENLNFAKALIDSGNQQLTHSIGSHDPIKTILTEEEFVTQLTKTRKRLMERFTNGYVKTDFGEGFLFSAENIDVTSEDVEKYQSGKIIQFCEKHQYGKDTFQNYSVTVYANSIYRKVIKLTRRIPTVDHRTLAYNSWHSLYLVQENNGNIFAVYCIAGSLITKVKGYAKVYLYPNELKCYFDYES